MDKKIIVETQKKSKLRAIGEYIDNCINIVATIFVADVLLRLLRVVHECSFYASYYLPERRLCTIFKRAFQYNLASIALLLTTLVAACTRMRQIPRASFLAYIPLYWIFYAVNFGYSSLDYAYWLRGDHGLEYAASMSSSYFHGYLKLTIPSYNGSLGMRKRIDLYEQEHGVEFITNRLVILVPNEIISNWKIESSILEKVKVNPSLKEVNATRGGSDRTFKNDVYRITKPINGKYYYVCLEAATPVLTYFESLNFQLTTTWQMQETHREVLRKFDKHLRRLFRWHEMEEDIELMLYNPYKDDGELYDVGELWLENFLREQGGEFNRTLH